MHIITPDSESFLRRYLNNASPTGYEWSGQKLWLEYLKPYIDEWQLDNYGTAYGIINPGQPYKVVIEGHADEISWFVNYISDDGFIHVIRNGGSDFLIAPSMRVWVHLRHGGKIEGVFGWPAIHTRTDKDASLTPALDNITIDIGAKDRDEVLKMGIHVGCVVTFQDELTILNDRFYTGRALDNRLVVDRHLPTGRLAEGVVAARGHVGGAVVGAEVVEHPHRLDAQREVRQRLRDLGER